MCGDDVWDGWMVYGLKLEKTYKILMNLHRKTTKVSGTTIRGTQIKAKAHH
jgi:hypothetical protein